MRYVGSLIAFICACAVSTCLGQQRTRPAVPQERPSLVIVPREIALPIIAYQPDCPLQFENVLLVGSVEGGGAPSYQVRNRGTRPIRAFKIEVRTSVGTGWGQAFEAKTPAEWIMPGKGEPPLPSSESRVVPLTAELREKLKLNGPMKVVVVFMVVSVEYSDGTKYNDETAFKALEAYFEDLGSRPER